MRRSVRKFNIPPPGQPPGHLNFWRLACSNSLSSGQKSRSNASPITTKIPLLKDKFRLQSNTLHAFFERVIHWQRGNAVNPSNAAKTKKTHGGITWEQEINLVQIPHPSNATFKFPPPRARCTGKCPGYARGGGCWSFELIGALLLNQTLTGLVST